MEKSFPVMMILEMEEMINECHKAILTDTVIRVKNIKCSLNDV